MLGLEASATAIGQASTPPVAPLIVNAVHNAIGVWIEEIPLTRRRVLDALQSRRPGLEAAGLLPADAPAHGGASA